VGEFVSLPPHTYTKEQSAKVYDAAMERAANALAAGHAVIMDAVFARPDERARAEALARRHGAGFTGFWLDADASHMAARVRARASDASDATAEVVAKQLSWDIGDMAWHRLQAGGTVSDTWAAARHVLGV
jgi:predicted kinase